MFQDLRRRLIETGFWRIWDAAQSSDSGGSEDKTFVIKSLEGSEYKIFVIKSLEGSENKIFVIKSLKGSEDNTFVLETFEGSDTGSRSTFEFPSRVNLLYCP